MRLLITGGNGFLGKHVVKELTNNNVKVYDAGHLGGKKFFNDKNELSAWTPSSHDANITSKLSLTFGLKDMKIDAILHMAAVCGGILANKNSPADFLRDNTQMALNIYEFARESNIKNVYSLGSVCAYPKYCPAPFKEDNIWNGPAEETNFLYGQAKRTLMMLGQTYRQQYGIKGAHLIPVNLCGEYDHFDPINSHVIPALIKKFETARTQNLPQVQCWGTGDATREFLYAGDAAEVIVKTILTNFDSELPINIGTGTDISIKDLAFLIKELTEYQGEIVFTGEVSDGQPKRMLDVSRAKELLNWEAKTQLKEALIKTISWYREAKP